MVLATPTVPRTVLLLALGTRGDVHPILALAKHLLRTTAAQNVQFRVVIVVLRDFAAWVEAEARAVDLGGRLVVRVLPGSFKEPLSEASAAIVEGKSARAIKVLFDDPIVNSVNFDLLVEYSRDADAIVAGLGCGILAMPIAAARGLPLGTLATMPFLRTRYLPPVYLGDGDPKYFEVKSQKDCEANLERHARDNAAWWGRHMPMFNEWLARLGVAPLPDVEAFSQAVLRMPAHCIWSKLVVPKPEDWPEQVHVGGFVFASEDDELPLSPELDAFLDRDIDNPPVYLGWGSMPVAEGDRMIELVSAVVRAAPPSMRFVVFLGELAPRCGLDSPESDSELYAAVRHGLSEELSPRVHLIRGSASHVLLFPRCAAIVTHGGAGTIGAALRSGRPIAPVPLAFDQPFWALRVHQLGCAAQPLLFRHATGARVVQHILDALRPDVVARAAQVGESIRAEDGIRAAADWVLDLAAGKLGAAAHTARRNGNEGPACPK